MPTNKICSINSISMTIHQIIALGGAFLIALLISSCGGSSGQGKSDSFGDFKLGDQPGDSSWSIFNAFDDCEYENEDGTIHKHWLVGENTEFKCARKMLSLDQGSTGYSEKQYYFLKNEDISETHFAIFKTDCKNAVVRLDNEQLTDGLTVLKAPDQWHLVEMDEKSGTGVCRVDFIGNILVPTKIEFSENRGSHQKSAERNALLRSKLYDVNLILDNNMIDTEGYKVFEELKTAKDMLTKLLKKYPGPIDVKKYEDFLTIENNVECRPKPNRRNIRFDTVFPEIASGNCTINFRAKEGFTIIGSKLWTRKAYINRRRPMIPSDTNDNKAPERDYFVPSPERRRGQPIKLEIKFRSDAPYKYYTGVIELKAAKLNPAEAIDTGHD